jgi:glycolate oxidase FAD binding subunit
MVEFTAWPTSQLTFKANLLPAAVASFCARAEALAEGILLQAHAGSGVVRGHLSGDLTLGGVQAMLEGLHQCAGEAQGNLVLVRCPPDWKRTLPVWGRPRTDTALMRRVKEKLDPKRLFNPGRFVDGI